MATIQPPAAFPPHIPPASPARPVITDDLPIGFDLAPLIRPFYNPHPPNRNNAVDQAPQFMVKYKDYFFWVSTASCIVYTIIVSNIYQIVEMAICFLNRELDGRRDLLAVVNCFNRRVSAADSEFRPRGWNPLDTYIRRTGRIEYANLRQRYNGLLP